MIIVFASGSGTNFEAVVRAFPNKVTALVCNIENALVISKANKLNVPCFVVPHKIYNNRANHEIAIFQNIQHILKNIKIIVFAGYMRILSKTFFEKIENILPELKLINLHPAPLDLYKGAHALEYAVENKFSRWGLSVHDVIPEIDSGKLLNFIEFPIFPYESVKEVKEKTKILEHNILINTIHNILSKEKILI